MLPTTLVIKDGIVLTPRKMLKDAIILIEDGKIKNIATSKEIAIPEGAEIISAEGKFVAPGFIDIHVNGGGGGDALDGNLQALQKMIEVHAEHGTTAMVPTIVTAPVENMIQAVENIAQAMEASPKGSEILGAFLEGPYISLDQKGAHNPKHIKEPDPQEYEKFLALAKHILIMGLAPELPGALELGEVLHKEDIVPAIAHSNANYKETINALEHGFTHVVHLFSSLSTWTRRMDEARKIAGITEAALLSDELTVELIGDGKHVPGSLLQLALKTKGLANVCTVTDAIRAAGLGPGKYQLGDLDIIVEDGVAKLVDRSTFAGSVVTMDLCVRNMVNLGGLSIQDAVKTATINPARIIGVEENKGSLVEGKDADIVIFDKKINISITIVGGEVVYQQDGS